MSAKNYIPQNDAQLLPWLNKFVMVFPPTAYSLGITPSEIAALMALVHAVIDDFNRYKSQEKIPEKEAALGFIISLIDRMEKHPAYKSSKFAEKLNRL